MPRKKLEFCVNGHDISTVGRNATRHCRACIRTWAKIRCHKISNENILIRSSKQFCIKGHDTLVCGRTKNGHCKDCDHKRRKINYENNRESNFIQARKWKLANPEKIRKIKLKNQTNRSLRIVKWTDWDKIDDFEKNKPKGMTTDHIIPLQGKMVSGLHVSWNLQYLTKSENSKKNKFVNLNSISTWYGDILKTARMK